MSIIRYERGPIASHVVVWKDTIYLAGQVAPSASGSVKEQTREILERIDGLLEQAGSNRTRLLTATIWLADIATWADMNEVWQGWIDPDNPPARATVEARLAAPEYLVEIMVTAAVA